MPRLQAVDRSDVPALPISPRLRSQLVYFSSNNVGPGVPTLGPDEFFFPEAEVARALDEGVIELVSPLDTANTTEVEISDEQEAFLQWLQTNRVQHVRVAT